MKKLKAIGIGFLMVILLGAGATFHYFLPKHAVVVINGVEVKRMDAQGVINSNNVADGPTRDVYFINTGEPDNSVDVSVFRNADTGFGFPWYFKFDSADVQAKAQELSKEKNQLALIQYYGWRIRLISAFPNIVSIEKTNTRTEPFPIFNTVFLFFLFSLLWFAYWKVKTRLRKRQSDPSA
jgi:hypothetical protein